jgi:hypothetical protein
MSNPPAFMAEDEDKTAQQWIKTVVYGKQGEWPTEEDELIGWRILSFTIVAGGGVEIVIERDLGLTDTRLKDRKLTAKSNWIIDVWQLDENGERLRGLCCGEVVEEDFVLAKNETEVAIATIPPNWTGVITEGQLVYDEITDDTVIVHHDLEFNPLNSDGRIIGNRTIDNGDNYELFDFWIDPESLNEVTEDSILFERDEWDIFSTLKTLTKFLNPDEEFVKNPTLSESFFIGLPDMKNIRLPRGLYLSDYLSMLLPSFGCDWFYDFSTVDGTTHTQPVIRIFKRGEGPQLSLPLDDIGESIDVSALEEMGFSFSINNTRNITQVSGALKEFEITIRLYKGWDDEHDGHEEDFAEDLDSPVGRRWVANEGGDYFGQRPSFEIPVNLGDEFVPKRRHIMDCLRYQEGGGSTQKQRRAAFVEWRDDGSSDWKPLSGSGVGEFHIMPDQIGIWFPKQALQLLDPDVQIRITGTVRSDERLTVEYDDTATSVNGRPFYKVLDESSQFHYRQLRSGGPFTSQLSGAGDTVDDTSRAEEYAERIGSIQRAATVGATPKLTGFRHAYEVGYLVTGVDGREISFNCLSVESEDEAFPQITSVRFELVRELMTYPTLMPYTQQDPDGQVGRRRRAK